MRFLFLLLLMLSAACVPLDDVVGTGRARFPDFPEPLYAAFKAACDGPAQSYRRPKPGIAECRELLPPEATAAILLQFDGTLDDLPELVIRFTTTEPQAGAGYLVQNDIYLNVPQPDATALQIRIPDRQLDRTIEALYRRAGGIPE